MNLQKVNDSKTEMMLIGSMHLQLVEFQQFLIGDEIIMPADSFRHPRVQFDSKMRPDKQITSIVKMSKGHVSGSIMSVPILLRNHGSCLYYQPFRLLQLSSLWATQKSNSSKYDHITPILKDLHWLPVQQQINFKILLFTFKCLHGQTPKYFQDLLTWSQPKGLMSDNKLLPVVPKSKQVTYGEHAFSNAAPRLWNALPNYIKLSVNIEVFKCHLKTHLFKEFYV